MPETPKIRLGVHPAIQKEIEKIKTLKDSHGRTVLDWAALAKEKGGEDPVGYLQNEHGYSRAVATQIAQYIDRKAEDVMAANYELAAKNFLKQQLFGTRRKIRPLLEEFASMAEGLHKDLVFCPTQQSILIAVKDKPVGALAIGSSVDLIVQLILDKDAKPEGLQKLMDDHPAGMTHGVVVRKQTGLDDNLKAALEAAIAKATGKKK